MSKSFQWEHVTARPSPAEPAHWSGEGGAWIEEQAGWVGEPAARRAEFERGVRTARASLRGVTVLLAAGVLLLLFALLSLPPH